MTTPANLPLNNTQEIRDLIGALEAAAASALINARRLQLSSPEVAEGFVEQDRRLRDLAARAGGLLNALYNEEVLSTLYNEEA